MQTVLSLFGEDIISATGAFHFQHGAVYHKTYIERAMQLGGEIIDCILPPALNEEVRYDGEGRIGHWVALNESDENGGRRAHTSLEVHTVTNWNMASWKFTDELFRNWASGWSRWSPRDYQTMSYCLNTVLRHLGCMYGQFLGRLKCIRSRLGTWRVGSSQTNFSGIRPRDGLIGLLLEHCA